MLPFSHTVAILTCFVMLGGQEPPNNAQKRANRCTCLRRLKNVCAPWPPVALSCYAVPHFGPKVLSGYGRWLRNKARDIPLPRLSRLSWSWFNMVQQTQWVFDHVHLYPHHIHVFFKQLSQVYIHWDQFCSIISLLPPRLRWILPRREQRCSSKPSLGAAWWPAYSMINPCNHEPLQPLQPLHEQNTTWNLCSVLDHFWIYCIHWISFWDPFLGTFHIWYWRDRIALHDVTKVWTLAWAYVTDIEWGWMRLSIVGSSIFPSIFDHALSTCFKMTLYWKYLQDQCLLGPYGGDVPYGGDLEESTGKEVM